jgi:hypothetical protein
LGVLGGGLESAKKKARRRLPGDGRANRKYHEDMLPVTEAIAQIAAIQTMHLKRTSYDDFACDRHGFVLPPSSTTILSAARFLVKCPRRFIGIFLKRYRQFGFSSRGFLQQPRGGWEHPVLTACGS